AVFVEELELFVADLELPDKARRVTVSRRKRRDLELVAHLYRVLVEARGGQHLGGRRRQYPLRRRPVFVRNGKMAVRVLVREVQLEESALQRNLLVQGVGARDGVMRLYLGTEHQESTERDQTNCQSVHRC